MHQRWSELLFAHWRADPDGIRRQLPAGLELDLHAGEAWVGVIPFRMSAVRGRLLPPLPGVSAFPELNVRTYVRAGGVPGIWFFSLDATRALAVAAARACFHLPYFRARMRVEVEPGDPPAGVRYTSARADRRSGPAQLDCSYRGLGEAFAAAPGTLVHFLVERYCLYARGPRGILRAEIHHAPWSLRRAEAQWRENSMAAASGLILAEGPPLLHWADPQRAYVWRPHALARS